MEQWFYVDYFAIVFFSNTPALQYSGTPCFARKYLNFEKPRIPTKK
jgi:hypothetical protein